MTLSAQLAEDLAAMLDAEGKLRSVAGRDILSLWTEEGAGQDAERAGVSVRVARLACAAADLPAPRIGRRLDVDGEEWTVSRVQDKSGLLTVQLYREAS